MPETHMSPQARKVSVLLAIGAALVLAGGCAGSPSPRTPRLHYLIANGDQDGQDKYSSVVQVIVPDRGACSGILVGSRLVLTAAHCLCIPVREKLQANTTYSVTPARRQNSTDLRCSQTVEIVATLYSPANGVQRSSPAPSGASKTDARALPFKGSVRVQVHEGYQFQTDEAADVVASQMDLAAVYLDGAFEGVRVDGGLPDREIQTGEVLIAVGYGPTETEPAGTRYFGTAKVLDMEFPSGSDKVLAFGRAGVPFRDVYALRGDSGGPCFHEDTEGHRWLVGIMSHGAEQADNPITFFTSAFRHREWINRQKVLSEQYARTR